MDEAVTRYARELVDAIASAAARDTAVEACRRKARAAGYEMRVTLEALVSFAGRPRAGRPAAPAPSSRDAAPRRPFEVTASDRRFLRSLRIAADEATEEVE
jgi:hypothetical protein